MQLSKTERIDMLNMGLMLLSCAVAIILPFELFLISYAILGPLHYLTEISWLQEKNFYTTGRKDGIILAVITICLALVFYDQVFQLNLNLKQDYFAELIFFGLACALIMAVVKNTMQKVIGFVFVFLLSPIAVRFPLFLTMFLPSLIHVYIFTGLFMLYGALKSKSRTGLISVLIFGICPALLWYVLPNTSLIPLSAYGKAAYFDNGTPGGFFLLNLVTLNRFFGVLPQGTNDEQLRHFWINAVFHSKTGILLARTIAFAYTYHYLNWFSKTSIIQWYKMPKWKIVAVIIVWLFSMALYAWNYVLGANWLFLLSFLHVMLEFPLNFVSILGISKEIRTRLATAIKRPGTADIP